jgi:guanylate kinase
LSDEGLVVVITAPSGSGKTTIYRKLLQRRRDISFSVSYTTRKRRPVEVDGVDYFFISRREFERKISVGDFIEWAEVHGELKGTDRRHLEECIHRSSACILDVDVQGAVNIMQAYPEALTIFIRPPSLEELKNRLMKRGTENEEELQVRLRNAEKELEYRGRFQYIVVNDQVENAVNRIEEIIDRELLGRR